MISETDGGYAIWNSANLSSSRLSPRPSSTMSCSPPTWGAASRTRRPSASISASRYAARPDVSWFFDRAYHLQKYPDIQAAGVDPLIHFMRWGVSELRSPHPLIDLRHIRETDPTLLPEKPTIEALHALLCHDLIDPSRLFSLELLPHPAR